MTPDRQYIAIDLKSFYASVECVERGLDPLQTHLVVADLSRTDKTICLAVTPSLKAYGISGRARLFEVEQRVRQVNLERLCFSPEGLFSGRSSCDPELRANPSLELDFIVARPRMSLYMEYSRRIYSIYLQFVAPEDIVAYSVDEVFIDATGYLASYGVSAHELAMRMVRRVLQQTGITATAGIGTNLYLAKVAMDIVAKHMPADKDGVRIAELDEAAYRRQLWTHRPLTDFWRVGRGTARRLEENGMRTMGDVARRSLSNPAMLRKMFGVNAELLIDHAWGYEPCTMKAIKAYRPDSNSLGVGQVLSEPYPSERARVVLREMADTLSLSLVDKGMVADQLVVTVNYDAENEVSGADGQSVDYYGRTVPKHAHGSVRLPEPTSSVRLITEAAVGLFDSVVDTSLSIRRLNVSANHVVPMERALQRAKSQQLNLFDDAPVTTGNHAEEQRNKELRMQQAALQIKKKFGKNALLYGFNFEPGATAQERNKQIGGHKA